MIEGSYTGASSSGVYGTAHTTIGVNVPESKVSKGGWSIYYWTDMPISNTSLIEGTYSNTLVYGEQYPNSHTGEVIFTPEEAWNIDTKMDDGQPGMGKLVVRENINPACYLLADGSAGATSTTAARANIVYNLSNKVKNCAFLFRDVF